MRFTRKSWKDASKLPCQERPAPRMAVSMTLVAVGPGVGFAPPFVPSHFCGPLPSLPSTVWAAGVTGPSKIVFDGPSTRTVTVVVAASAVAAAGAADAAAAARTARAPVRVFIWISLPFREGFVAFGRRQVSWLPGSPVRAFPGSVAPQWPRAAGPPGHSGGTAPVSHRTSLDHRPLVGGRIHPRGVRSPGGGLPTAAAARDRHDRGEQHGGGGRDGACHGRGGGVAVRERGDLLRPGGGDERGDHRRDESGPGERRSRRRRERGTCRMADRAGLGPP